MILEAAKLLNYDSNSGLLTWRIDRGYKYKAGTIAGTLSNKGYIHIKIGGVRYTAHRLAWVIYYGSEPTNEIDHINRIRNDNRISNLRDVTKSENCRNRSDNTFKTRQGQAPRKVLDLTLELANKFLEYNGETGVFSWRIPNGNYKPGPVKGSISSDGHILIRVCGRRYPAHRLAWLMYYGIFPNGEIDHINRIGTDNRIINLRIVSRSENCKNRKIPSNNTSGYKGVSWNKGRNLWMAQISKDLKITTLGYFEDKLAAYEAYVKASLELFPGIGGGL
jgi:hypothetical protein